VLHEMSYLQLCLCFLAALCAIVLVIYGAAAIEYRRGKGPRLSVQATLKSKRTALGSEKGKEAEPRFFTLYYGTFLFKNRDVVELELEKTQYDTMSVGTSGALVFKGSHCVSFEQN